MIGHICSVCQSIAVKLVMVEAWIQGLLNVVILWATVNTSQAENTLQAYPTYTNLGVLGETVHTPRTLI